MIILCRSTAHNFNIAVIYLKYIQKVPGSSIVKIYDIIENIQALVLRPLLLASTSLEIHHP
jgi:hypothetical protein